MSEPILTTALPGLPRYAQGKVRDIYDLGETLLLVTTDRISAYDAIMPNGIPDKGRILTGLSRFWFLHLRPFLSNHYITTDMDFIAARMAEKGVTLSPELHQQLNGRTMLTLKAKIFPVECVVRGYLAGSLWKEYREAGGETKAVTLHGIALPGGMRESERLPAPIFTPATKATSDHDMNISLAEMSALVGEANAQTLAQTSLKIYGLAAERLQLNGLLLADTKFEFGLHNDTLLLADEVLTPDSSRFWDASAYEPGRPQASFDKQFLRDWLAQSGWNREPPAPTLPPDIVAQTRERYVTAYRRITGEDLLLPG